MKKYLLHICLIITLYSCTESTNFNFIKASTPNVTYENTEIPTLKIFDTICTDIYGNEFDSVKYVKLEMSDKCVIRNITKVHIHNNQIIIVDQSTNEIHIFDEFGKFLKSINKKGNGPGEYVALSNVSFGDSSILITDWMSLKFLQYDFNGNFIKERHNVRSASWVWPLSDKSFVEANCIRENPYELTFTNENQTEVGWARPHKTNLPLPSGTLIRGYDGNLYYLGNLCDTIFLVSENSLKPYLNLGLRSNEALEHFYAEAFATKNNHKFSKYVDNKSPIPVFCRFIENKDYWMIQFHDDKYGYVSVIDRATNMANTYLQQDWQRGNVYNIVKAMEITDDNWVVSTVCESDANSVSQKRFEESIAQMSDEKLKEEIRNLVDLDSDCNGLVMFFHIKKK